MLVLGKGTVPGVEQRKKAKLKAGYNDRTKKAGRYSRQKFGTLEHRNVFSDIYNFSRDLSPSFVLMSMPQWETPQQKPK